MAVDNAVMCINDKVLFPILDGMNKNPKAENFLREVCCLTASQTAYLLFDVVCKCVCLWLAGLFCNKEYGIADLH